jgi:hypothetical protein
MLIQTEFQQNPFVAVPRHVLQLVGEKISPEALGVLVWLAGRPVGAQLQVGTICRAMRFGKDKWQRIARELRAVGALIVAPIVCHETNRMFGQSYAVRWPEAPAKASQKPSPRPLKAAAKKPAESTENPRAGKPASRHFPRAGFSGYKKPENPALSYKENIIKEGEGAQIAPERAETDPQPGASRRAVAAALGLPVLDPETGRWRLAGEFAEKEERGPVDA